MHKNATAACITACLFMSLTSVASAQTTPPADPAAQTPPAAQDAAPAKTKMTSQQKVALAVGAFAAIMKAVQDAKAAAPATQPAAAPVQP